jgi:hypothetical protein
MIMGKTISSRSEMRQIQAPWKKLLGSSAASEDRDSFAAISAYLMEDLTRETTRVLSSTAIRRGNIRAHFLKTVSRIRML